MLHQTKGVIIRTVKYGETSLVVSAYTELFGLQQYMVNGVRTSKKTVNVSASHLQVGNILDMVVYKNEKDTLQRIKECKLAVHYDALFADVMKNAIMLFMIEVLQKCIKEPDHQPELYYFIEDILKGLDAASAQQTANMPLFFMIHLSHFFGFRLMDNYTPKAHILDLHEGQFVESLPLHQMVVMPPNSEYIAQYLRVMQLAELEEIKMNRVQRNAILDACLQFYAMHIHPFGTMKTLPIIRTLLEE